MKSVNISINGQCKYLNHKGVNYLGCNCYLSIPSFVFVLFHWYPPMLLLAFEHDFPEILDNLDLSSTFLPLTGSLEHLAFYFQANSRPRLKHTL